MTNKINDKIKQLVDDLIHNPEKYSSLVIEYTESIDINSFELKYTNIYTDIQLLTTKLIDIYENIYNHFTMAIRNVKKKHKKRLFKEVKNNLKVLILNCTKLNAWLDFFKYNIFEENDKNVDNFIDSIKVSEIKNNKTQHLEPNKKTISFKNYLKSNIKLYQAYYDTLYIYMFQSIINGLKAYTYKFVVYKVLSKYLLNCRKEIYKYQLHVENSAVKASKNVEQSKQIIHLMNEKNIPLTELYNNIITNARDYNILIKSKIQLQKINLKFDKTITLHKFHTKEITDNILKKTFGLCNPDLYNILNNSNLPLCYSNKSFKTLYNDIRINLRGSADNENAAIALSLLDDDIFTTINTYINLNRNYLQNGYFIEVDNNDCIYFSRDAIIDIDFSMDEYKQLDKTIIECENRYIFIYCSQVPFNQKGFDAIKKHFKGGHKVSLLIDKEKKEILFFDPFGFQEYSIYNNSETMDISMIYILLALELSKNLYSLNNYKFLYADNEDNVVPQAYEYPYEHMNKLYGFNIKQALTKSGKELRDWAGGYCGLWNYLYIFLLIINPDLDLVDIYSFFDKIIYIENNDMFYKLLIRNFAYYIENALINQNYVIPLTKLDMTQFNDENINTVKFNSNSNTLLLNKMKKTDYYRENSTNIAGNTDKQNFNFDKFIKNHTNLKSLFTDIKVAKNVTALVSDFSKYLFAKGGLALYTPDKINFLKV